MCSCSRKIYQTRIDDEFVVVVVKSGLDEDDVIWLCWIQPGNYHMVLGVS